jgi:hypothetical protein
MASVDLWVQHLPILSKSHSDHKRIHFQSVVAREVSSEKEMRNIDWKEIGLSDGDMRSDMSITSRKTTFIPPRQQQGEDKKWPAVAFFHHSVSILWTNHDKRKASGTVIPSSTLRNSLNSVTD